MTSTAAREQTAVVSVNPATGDILESTPCDDASSIASKLAQARIAAEFWGELEPRQRRDALLRWGARLENQHDELCALIHRENGKPVDDAYLEISLATGHIDWAAKKAPKILAPQKVSPGPVLANFAAHIEHRPLGVIGVIGPWNYPIYTPVGSIAYALAAGNTVLFKPSEFTTLIGNYLVDAFTTANPEFPPGILTAVNGFGATGAALVTAGVDKIAFTGSTPTGKKIMAAAAENLTPVLLECGGKDPVIIAADANVKAAADAVAWGAMANGGQTCVGVERVYVVKDVRDEFVAELRAALKGVAAGKQYGPMTMPRQVDVVREHIKDALASGGRALIGGVESVRPPYIDPVVLIDVDEQSLAVREETFGPTVTITVVADIDEAVERANDTKYGLASTVFSAAHGVEIARRLRVGATSINAPLAFAGVSALPFGGVGESGIGRIHGEQGLLEFTRTHSIARQRFAIPGMALLSFTRKDATLALVKRLVHLLYGRAR